MVCHGKRGVDRNKMIEELQEIHRFGDKKHLEAAEAKQREMRKKLLAAGPIQVDNKTRLRDKYNMKMPQNAAKNYEVKYGKNPNLNNIAHLQNARNEQDNEL